MRIVQLLTTFIAVLAAVARPWCGAQHHNNSSYIARRFEKSLPPYPSNHWSEEESDNLRYRTMKEMQATLRRESEGGKASDCCPSVLEMIEPEGGKNEQGMHVVLYRHGDVFQRFYEVSCQKNVENKPCRFIERKLYNQSRCVQKFSYQYALVIDPNGKIQRHQKQFTALSENGVTMDYIRLRSGCSCEISPKERRHRKTSERRRKQERRGRHPASPPEF